VSNKSETVEAEITLVVGPGVVALNSKVIVVFPLKSSKPFRLTTRRAKNRIILRNYIF
jgi:hypothetical protein